MEFIKNCALIWVACICLWSHCTHSELLDIPQPVTIDNVKLVDVDYFKATFEADININGILPRAYLSASIPNVKSINYPVALTSNQKKVTFHVSRLAESRRAKSSVGLDIAVYQSNNEPLYTKSTELGIYWPKYKKEHHIPQDLIRIGFPAAHSIEVTKFYINGDLKDARYYADLAIAVIWYDKENINIVYPSQNSHQTAPKTLHIAGDLDPDLIQHIFKLYSSVLDETWQWGFELTNGDPVITIGGVFDESKLTNFTPAQLRKTKQERITAYDLVNEFGLDPAIFEGRLDRLLITAQELLDSGQPDELKRALNLLHDITQPANGDQPRARLELARYALKSNKWPQGLETAEWYILSAQKMAPEMADVYVLLGYVYTNQERYSEAESAYQKAEQLGTNNMWLYANWGLNFEKQNLKREAAQKYLRVAESTSTDRQSKRARFWVFNHSQLFSYLLFTKQYKLSDTLYTKAANEYEEFICKLTMQANLRVSNLGDIEGALESIALANKSGCNTGRLLLPLVHYYSWATYTGKDNAKALASYKAAKAIPVTDELLAAQLAQLAIADELFPKLIENGLNIDHTNKDGMTALLYLISAGELDGVKTVVKYGADINKTTRSIFYTPIVHAISQGQYDITKYLIEAGANTNIIINQKYTLAALAKHKKHNNIAELLLKTTNTTK